MASVVGDDGSYAAGAALESTEPMKKQTLIFIALTLLATPLVVAQPTRPVTQTAEARVTVLLRGPDGQAVGRSWVALVPGWRPWSRPLAEAVADEGRAGFTVPPGEYRVVAGAEGHAVTTRGPVSFGAAETTLTLDLPRLITANGTVLDQEGRPIPGATVETMNGAVVAPSGMLTALAADLLRPDLSVTTNADGSWQIGLPEGPTPLLVSAPGYAAQWRIVDPAQPAPTTVRLTRGAKLEVSMDREDPDLIVTLSPEDPGLPTTVPPGKQTLIWGRWAQKDHLQWSSLPPGTYRIEARYPDPRRFMDEVTIGMVTLDADEVRSLSIALPPAIKPAGQSVGLFLPGVAPEELERPLEGLGREPRQALIPVPVSVEESSGGVVIHLNTERVVAPFFAITEDAFVSVDRSLPSAPEDPAEELWSTIVKPRVDALMAFHSAVESLVIPPYGVAQFRGDCTEGVIEIPFSISEVGDARFAAPAGCRELVLRVEPFEPVPIHRRLPPGVQSLGEFFLHAAGSADVHVVRTGEDEPVESATVRVVEVEEPRGAEVFIGKAVTDESGWARLTSLPPYRGAPGEGRDPEGRKIRRRNDSAPAGRRGNGRSIGDSGSRRPHGQDDHQQRVPRPIPLCASGGARAEAG